MLKLIEEYKEAEKLICRKTEKAFQPKITATVPKSDYHPVKDVVKDLEHLNDNKTKDDTNKSKENNKLNETKLINNEQNEKLIENKLLNNKINEYNKMNTEENDKVNVQNVVPPKPLPRTSRTGSVCEQSEDLTPKPVARPRTNSLAPVVTSVNPNIPIAGGYKVNNLSGFCRFACFFFFIIIISVLHTILLFAFYYY